MYDRGLGVLEQYGLTAETVLRGRGALICHTEKGWKSIREYWGSPGRLEQQRKIQKRCKETGFCPPGKGSRPFQGGNIQRSKNVPFSKTPPKRYRPLILLDSPLRCPVNLPCVTSFPNGSADAAFSSFIIQYPAPVFLPKIFQNFRGFGKLPNKQKSPPFSVEKAGILRKRVLFSYAC